MDLEGKQPDKSKRPEHLRDRGKGFVGSLDITRLTLHDLKRPQHPGLGPDRPASHSKLVEQYDFLLRSVPFQQLDQVATSHKMIILEDSSQLPGRPTVYNRVTHRIRIPLKDTYGRDRPLTEIRRSLSWELQNAASRGALERTSKLRPSALGPDASPQEKEIYTYKMATYALSKEWVEWTNIIEHVLCVRAINTDPNMGKGSLHVENRYEICFPKGDPGWFHFVNYLESQLEMKHTMRYDPNAANPDWVGKKILAKVQEISSTSLIVTPRQIRDWQIGKTRKVKSLSNNPFTTSSIIEQTRRGVMRAEPLDK